VSTGARGYFVGESKAIPVSGVALAGSSLAAKKFAAIVVATKEGLVDPAAEGRISGDIANALTFVTDETFIDASNAGSGGAPAAVTNGAPSSVSAGNPAEDIATLVENFAGELDAAVLVTDPTTAAKAALARDAAGAFIFPALGPRGGSAINIPVLTSRASPRDSTGGQWALIDQGGIAAAFEGLDLVRSQDAALEVDSEPTGDAETPAAATANVISLFQAELVAFRGTIHANWERQRDGSVSVITSADYGTGS
jgi:hypothetical protein